MLKITLITVLILPLSVIASAEPAELSEEIKRKHLLLVRDYQVAAKAYLEAASDAASKSPVASVARDNEARRKSLEDLIARSKRVRFLSPDEQRKELVKMYQIAMSDGTAASESALSWSTFGTLLYKALLEAQKKSRAAAELLDFQIELIGTLTDQRIELKFISMEPPQE